MAPPRREGVPGGAVLAYAARRALLAIPLLWGVVTLIFVLVELSPGTYADKFISPEMAPAFRDAVCARYRCDDPALTRYLALLGNLARLDFGSSLSSDRSVFELIAEALPNTLLLGGVSLAVAWPAGVALGTLQAVRHDTWTDRGISLATLGLHSMPAFWLATMLQLWLSFQLGGWIRAHAPELAFLALPSAGMTDPVRFDEMTGWEQLVDRARHLALPGVAMGLASAAGAARYMRSSVLDVIRQDFIRTARAKGLRERTVVLRHALGNALLPILTLFGLSVPHVFSGAVLVESIFAWPGMGRLIYTAVREQDTPLVIACFFVSTCLVVAGNLLADVACAVADPRIRLDA